LKNGLFKIDLHVPASRRSADAEHMNPAKLADICLKRDLSGLVLTEHDALWSKKETAELEKRLGGLVKIYRGIEVNSCDGSFIVIGIEEISEIEPNISAVKLIEIARRYCAAVILTQPNRIGKGKDAVRLFPIELPLGIHAIEVFSATLNGEVSNYAKSLARERCWLSVAGSDAPSLEMVGGSYTVFPYVPKNERHLAEAIILGLGIPRQCEIAEKN
jgi:predicted metal-dependent phosphoesterase TrpH